MCSTMTEARRRGSLDRYRTGLGLGSSPEIEESCFATGGDAVGKGAKNGGKNDVTDGQKNEKNCQKNEKNGKKKDKNGKKNEKKDVKKGEKNGEKGGDEGGQKVKFVIFSREANPETPLGLNRWLLLLLYGVVMLVCGNVYWGWAMGLREMLFLSGAYKWRCGITGASSAQPVCVEQETSVGSLLTIGFSSHFGCSIFGGVFLDVLGPKITYLIGLFSKLSGWLLLAFSGQDFEAYIPAMMLIAGSVDISNFPTVSIGTIFPRFQYVAMSFLGGMGVTSCCIPLFMYQIWRASAPKDPSYFSTLIFGYAAVCLGFAIIVGLLFVPYQPFQRPQFPKRPHLASSLDSEAPQWNAEGGVDPSLLMDSEEMAVAGSHSAVEWTIPRDDFSDRIEVWEENRGKNYPQMSEEKKPEKDKDTFDSSKIELRHSFLSLTGEDRLRQSANRIERDFGTRKNDYGSLIEQRKSDLELPRRVAGTSFYCSSVSGSKTKNCRKNNGSLFDKRLDAQVAYSLSKQCSGISGKSQKQSDNLEIYSERGSEFVRAVGYSYDISQKIDEGCEDSVQKEENSPINKHHNDNIKFNQNILEENNQMHQNQIYENQTHENEMNQDVNQMKENPNEMEQNEFLENEDGFFEESDEKTNQENNQIFDIEYLQTKHTNSEFLYPKGRIDSAGWLGGGSICSQRPSYCTAQDLKEIVQEVYSVITAKPTHPEDQKFWPIFKDPIYFLSIPYFCLCMFRICFCTTAAKELFTDAYPFWAIIGGMRAPGVFGFGISAQRFGVLPALHILNTLGVAMYGLLLIPHPVPHYAAAFFGFFFTSCNMSALYCYISYSQPARHFGKCTGIACAITGLFQLLAIPLFDLSKNQFDNNMTVANVIMTVSGLIVYVLIWYMGVLLKRREAEE